jgi:hypothetical protein
VIGVGHLDAQASLSIERTEALIGDQLELSLQINTPTGTKWVNPDVVPADTVDAIDVVRVGALEETHQGGYTRILQKWTIAVFDTGLVRIPPLPVVLQNGPSTDTQYTNDIPLLISGVMDSLGLAPIKPIIREPSNFSDYLPYVLGVVGLILLIALVYWWSKRKPRQIEVVEIREQKPAHQIALEQLDALEAEKLWQQGQIKEYHSQLHHILREYLERRFEIRALESTTGEILAQLRSGHLSDELLRRVREVMEAEDLIKFAKAEPPVDVPAQYLDIARSLILQTNFEPQSPTEDV